MTGGFLIEDDMGFVGLDLSQILGFRYIPPDAGAPMDAQLRVWLTNGESIMLPAQHPDLVKLGERLVEHFAGLK